MRHTLKSILAGLVLLVVLSAPAAAGPFQDGLAAYEKRDYATALRLWRPLADRGEADAQYNLGYIYANGQGVPQDNALAHMWLNLAAGQGDEDAVTGRDLVAKKMTPAQIAEAQRLAREWKPISER